MDDRKTLEHDLTPIGSQAAKVVASLKASALTRIGQPASSETTGARFPMGREPGKRIGRQLSATDAASLLAVASQRADLDPGEVDKAILVLLPPSIASSLVPMWQDKIDPVYGFDTEFLGYRLAVEHLPAKDLMQARQMVGQHLRGADVALIKRELARLRASTKARAESDDDLTMGFQVLAEECAEYPPDVVVWALRGWAKMETFYPSLAEIRDRLQRGARKRRAMMAALDGARA